MRLLLRQETCEARLKYVIEKLLYNLNKIILTSILCYLYDFIGIYVVDSFG